MNMILHNNPTAEIWKDNTLSAPYWRHSEGGLKTFDFAVANPPFSYKSWSNGINLEEDEFQRFEYGTPLDKNGDYAFLLHILKSLKSKGKAAVILPHGVLFRGNAEARIRQNLLRQGYIKGIIGLPANLFYGTGIPACIIVIDKERASELTENIKQGSNGSTMAHVTKGEMENYSITLPEDTQEQRSIAQILSDMDTEITALETRLHKTKELKQGMMQELLTGRTRL